MDELINSVLLCGTVCEQPVFSHESRGIRFYIFSLASSRLSGTEDRVNVIARQSLLSPSITAGARIQVEGELRSFNNKSGVGAKLVITVYARVLEPTDSEDENLVALHGTICRPPVGRRTPLGREICDFILAVPRRYSRSDYIPVIAWGALAREATDYPVGTRLALTGRLQSRRYTKLTEGVAMERTAFELSAGQITVLGE